MDDNTVGSRLDHHFSNCVPKDTILENVDRIQLQKMLITCSVIKYI